MSVEDYDDYDLHFCCCNSNILTSRCFSSSPFDDRLKFEEEFLGSDVEEIILARDQVCSFAASEPK